MKLTLEGIKNTTVFQKAGILLPGYDVAAVSKKAKQAPRWAHFGIGNIFRIFIGGIADGLLEAGVLDRGLTCIETFDYDVVDKIYTPYDNLGLSVILHADGTRTYKVLGSMAEAVKAQSSDPAHWALPKEVFRSKMSCSLSPLQLQRKAMLSPDQTASIFHLFNRISITVRRRQPARWPS